MANSRLCSIPDCGKPVQSLGYCTSHYTRLRRHGDPLAGRTPDGEPMRFYLNAVSYDDDECLIWPYARNAEGYGVMNVGGKIRLVSRLICEEEYGPAPDTSIDSAHSCGNGHLGCINRKHLSWKTRTKNMADKLIHGTLIKGENHPASKLRDQDVLDIRSLIGKIPLKDIAKRFGVSDQTISKIKLGQCWAHLP